MKSPHYSLERIKEFVRNRKVHIGRKRGMDFFPGPRAAHDFVRRVCEQLTVEEHFVGSVKLAVDVADEYAIRIDDQGWYIKVCIDENLLEAEFISVHPLERTITTNAGDIEP